MPGLVPSPTLLASIDCTSQTHLVVGSNPLAGARCAKSLEVGAKVKLIAPDSDTLHYGLRERIDAGEVEWIQREFRTEDLTTLGREEVDHVVDLVFVTLPVGCAQCMSWFQFRLFITHMVNYIRHLHFQTMPETPNTRQRFGRTVSLHLHSAINVL